jgi:hypothetical protein
MWLLLLAANKRLSYTHIEFLMRADQSAANNRLLHRATVPAITLHDFH